MSNFELLRKYHVQEKQVRCSRVVNKAQLDHKPNRPRERGGKRWTADEEAHLLALVDEGHNSAAIAAILRRAFSSVQHRLRKLGRSTAEAIDPEKPKPYQRRMDLTCGEPSSAGRAVVEIVWEAIRDDVAITQRREPSRLSIGVRRIVGAIVREAMISSDSRNGWARIAISRVRTETAGVGSGVVRNLLEALERQGYLQRFLGYPGIVELDRSVARNGRVALLRATPRLSRLCARFDIRWDNIAAHFPRLTFKSSLCS